VYGGEGWVEGGGGAATDGFIVYFMIVAFISVLTVGIYRSRYDVIRFCNMWTDGIYVCRVCRF